MTNAQRKLSKTAVELVAGDEVSGATLILWRTPGLDGDGEVEALVRMADGGVTWRYWASDQTLNVTPDAASEEWRRVIEALAPATTVERAGSLYKRLA